MIHGVRLDECGAVLAGMSHGAMGHMAGNHPAARNDTKAIDVVIRANDPDTIRYLIPVLKDENEYARRAAVELRARITAGPCRCGHAKRSAPARDNPT